MRSLNVLSSLGVASVGGRPCVPGPLKMGLTGSGCGAGIRTSTSGTRGGTCAKAPAPPITQPAVDSMAKIRFMIVAFTAAIGHCDGLSRSPNLHPAQYPPATRLTVAQSHEWRQQQPRSKLGRQRL